MLVGGPMFEQPYMGLEKVISTDRGGAHYSVWHLDSRNGKVDSEIGMETLRHMFPDGEADDMNFVLFSTSGVHGTYTSIDEIEEGFARFGETFDPQGEWPDGWHGRELTVLVVHPRIVCLRCGNVRVRDKADIEWLKRLRSSSWNAVATIGRTFSAQIDEHQLLSAENETGAKE